MKKNNNGFTLAELLVVVAIIAVLVAISIPVFTTQLEKSREATDLANIRAGYAEIMTAAATEDRERDESVDGGPFGEYPLKSNPKVYLHDEGEFIQYFALIEITQTQIGWQNEQAIDSINRLLGDNITAEEWTEYMEEVGLDDSLYIIGVELQNGQDWEFIEIQSVSDIFD